MNIIRRNMDEYIKFIIIDQEGCKDLTEDQVNIASYLIANTMRETMMKINEEMYVKNQNNA